MKKLTAIAVAAAIAHAAAAQDDTNLVTAEHVVREALKHSIGSRLAEQELEAAGAAVDLASAAFLPQITADATAARYFGLEDTDIAPQFTIQGIENRYVAGLQARQIIWAGGEIEKKFDAAKARKTSAGHGLDSATADTRFAATAAYWTWSKAWHGARSLDDAIQRVQAHANDIANARAAGLTTENDELATAVLLDQTRLRRQDAGRRADIARLALCRLTGEEIPASAVPETALPPASISAPDEVEAATAAMRNRPEVRSADFDVRAADMLAESASAGSLPKFGASARVGAASPNMLFFPPSEAWNEDIYVGVGVQWNMWDWGMTSARHREAAARARQARLRREFVGEQVAYDAREAVVNLRQAAAAIPVAERARLSAEKNLASSTAQWEAGATRHAELLDAHAKLTETRFGAISAAADALIAIAAFERATAVVR